MIDAIEIGYAIKERRAELGLTQAQLAQISGVSKRCLWSLELGENPGVQLNKLTAVLEALGLDLTLSAKTSPKASSISNHPAPQKPNTDTAVKGIDAFAILTGGTR